MKTIKLHAVGKDISDQVNICSECFAIVEYEDQYCWQCGEKFAENSAYSMDDYKKEMEKL